MLFNKNTNKFQYGLGRIFIIITVYLSSLNHLYADDQQSIEKSLKALDEVVFERELAANELLTAGSKKQLLVKFRYYFSELGKKHREFQVHDVKVEGDLAAAVVSSSSVSEAPFVCWLAFYKTEGNWYLSPELNSFRFMNSEQKSPNYQVASNIEEWAFGRQKVIGSTVKKKIDENYKIELARHRKYIDNHLETPQSLIKYLTHQIRNKNTAGIQASLGIVNKGKNETHDWHEIKNSIEAGLFSENNGPWKYFWSEDSLIGITTTIKDGIVSRVGVGFLNPFLEDNASGYMMTHFSVVKQSNRWQVSLPDEMLLDDEDEQWFEYNEFPRWALDEEFELTADDTPRLILEKYKSKLSQEDAVKIRYFQDKSITFKQWITSVDMESAPDKESEVYLAALSIWRTRGKMESCKEVSRHESKNMLYVVYTDAERVLSDNPVQELVFIKKKGSWMNVASKHLISDEYKKSLDGLQNSFKKREGELIGRTIKGVFGVVEVLGENIIAKESSDEEVRDLFTRHITSASDNGFERINGSSVSLGIDMKKFYAQLIKHKDFIAKNKDEIEVRHVSHSPEGISAISFSIGGNEPSVSKGSLIYIVRTKKGQRVLIEMKLHLGKHRVVDFLNKKVWKKYSDRFTEKQIDSMKKQFTIHNSK